jgi:RNA polymerase sigma-70 factor (ECF subfamily)
MQMVGEGFSGLISTGRDCLATFFRMDVTNGFAPCLAGRRENLQGPPTRASLLASLNDPASDDAWMEFVCLYRPLIVRVALAKGMQHADAEDLAQDVLTTVGRAIDSFESRGEGSFRGWLFQITRNLVVNHLTRGGGPMGSGDSDVQQMLSQHPDPAGETATLFQLELRRVRFERAARRLKNQFSDSVWLSFWLTAVEGRSIKETAKRLGKTAGAVRVARCRVLSRLRSEVQQDELEDQA